MRKVFTENLQAPMYISFKQNLMIKKIDLTQNYLQHSGALCADEAADGDVDVGGTALLAVKALFVLHNASLDLPSNKHIII